MIKLQKEDNEFISEFSRLNSLNTDQTVQWLLSPLSNPNWYDKATEIKDGCITSLNIGGQKDDSIKIRDVQFLSKLRNLHTLCIDSSNVLIESLDLTNCRLDYLYLNYLTKLSEIKMCEELQIMHINTIRRLKTLDLRNNHFYPFRFEILNAIPKTEIICTELQKICCPILKKKKKMTLVLLSEKEIEIFLNIYNWDYGIEPLIWIAQNSECTFAMALKIYWMNRPEWYTQYSHSNEIPGHEEEGFNLKQIIENNYISNFYKRSEKSFNPKNDNGTCWIGTYPEISVKTPIPDVMYGSGS